ncbi:putative retrotransposon copia-like protein [Tanacetum coccineum]
MAGDSGKSADKTKEGGIDHDSPYYLHPSDYPRQMHVNDVLNDGNYADWSQEMLNFLFAKNKAGFINGSIKKPEEKSSEFMPWMRCDAMIKGWLHTAMEKEIRSSVKYAMTAREIWVDLKERFGKVSAPRAYELKRSLTFTKQDGTSVSAYYTKLRGIWDKSRAFYLSQGAPAKRIGGHKNLRTGPGLFPSPCRWGMTPTSSRGKDRLFITSLKCVLTQEHLDAICAKYFVPEEVHPQLPSSDATMHERPTGKVGMYTRFLITLTTVSLFSTAVVAVFSPHFPLHFPISCVWSAKVSHFGNPVRVCNIEPDDRAPAPSEYNVEHWNG